VNGSILGEGRLVPKASRQTASEVVQVKGYEGRQEHFGDDYTVTFETYTQDADLSPYFDGLPNNQCHAAHWGYVIKGKQTIRYGDREETYEAGDAYYIPPGHTPVLYAGTEIVEFSTTEELRRTIEVVSRNMEAAGG
jgi:mannose-6-phosphate isomerase-like protein (cupin superfamily)